MMTRAILATVVVMVAACGAQDVASTTAPSTTVAAAPVTTSAPTTAPTITTSTTSTTAATALPSTVASTAPTTSSPPATTAPTSTTTEVPVASCEPATLVAALNGLFTGNDLWVIVDVSIEECRNGYARVFAIPDMSSCPSGPCLESEQVFFQDVDGEWVYVDSGTGIECSDTAGLLPATVAACEALGDTP